jgi:hypothetical protein
MENVVRVFSPPHTEDKAAALETFLKAFTEHATAGHWGEKLPVDWWEK